MLDKPVNVSPTAAHVTKPTENKESMPKESDISALLEISVLLKILSSMNSHTPKKHLLVSLTKTLLAFLTTKDQKISVASVLKVLMPAHKTEVSPLDNQEPSSSVDKHDPFFIASLLYLLINFPRNYSLVHF